MRGVLARPKFGFPADEIAGLLAMFRGQNDLIVPKASTAVLVDPGDTKFLQCAETAQADYNKRHFPEANYGATRVVSASNCWPGLHWSSNQKSIASDTGVITRKV
jgi:hypothetical protein